MDEGQPWRHVSLRVVGTVTLSSSSVGRCDISQSESCWQRKLICPYSEMAMTDWVSIVLGHCDYSLHMSVSERGIDRTKVINGCRCDCRIRSIQIDTEGEAPETM